MPFTLHRPALAIGLALGLLLAGLAFVTSVMVVQAREDLLDEVARERALSLEQTSLRVEELLQDVADDVGFAAQLVDTAGDPAQRRELLATLVGSVRAYRGAFLVAGDGRIVDMVGDPRHPEAGAETMATLALQSAADALDSAAAGVQVSPPSGAHDHGWLRGFATRLPQPSATQADAVVVIADSAALLAPLTLLSAEEATTLLVLGPHGRVAPVSSPGMAEALAAGRLAPIMARVEGTTGSARLDARQAAAAGFPRADLLVNWRRVAIPGGDAWTVVTLSSATVLRALEAAVIRRIVGGALAAGLVLVVTGGWLLRGAQRAAGLAERLRVADTLAQLRERAERTLAHIPSSVLMLDADDRIVDTNPAARRRFGALAPGACISAAFAGASPAALELLEALLRDARSAGAPRELAEVVLDLDGHDGTWHVRVVPLEHAAQDLATLLVFDDLTELTRLRERLIRSEKLATVGELAAGIAHEIGTPLGVIRGRAEYIRGKLGEDHPQSPGLGVIVDQIERVVRTIRALLDFSRAQPSRVGSTPLGEVVERASALMAMAADAAGVELQVEVPAAVVEVRADPDQLEQVLVNLTKNAIDASAPGGRVLLRVGARHGALVRVEVIDHGHGIPSGDLHRVFDPFFTTRKRGRGTGLGLAVALQVVRAHGASLELESAPGRGTRAILDWPMAA